ncbi:MAG TPA: transposase, partial [Trueperaceae bacterium]|nr:transposase [Trueperaceae bacterium]
TVGGMAYTSDLTDEQWALLEPVFNTPGKRGAKHAPDLRGVVDAMLYVSRTGCQWGGSCPSRSGPGHGSGRSFAAGHATARGRER